MSVAGYPVSSEIPDLCEIPDKRDGSEISKSAAKQFLKPVFHFNRIVPKRSVFLCFLSGSVELMTST
jgi:hypothetical protein